MTGLTIIIPRDVARFGVVALFSKRHDRDRGLTRSPWLFVDSERSTSPILKYFNY